MCGIAGYIGEQIAGPIVLASLKKIEYRGYDSAGMASLGPKGNIELRRVEGKLSKLSEVLKRMPLSGNIAIGHTRWATHGKPSESNAHPHIAGRVAVVHNGIIENFLELRRKLEQNGCRFKSETDTEVIPHLVNFF